MSYNLKEKIGLFDGNIAIGGANQDGLIQYNTSTETYDIKGSSIPNNCSTYRTAFAWKRVNSDFILYSHIQKNGQTTNSEDGAGIMVREHLAPDSPYVYLALHTNGSVVLHYQLEGDTGSQAIYADGINMPILQMELSGATLTAKACHKGNNLSTVGSINIPWTSGSHYVGIFVDTGNLTPLSETCFSNVRLTVPAPPTFTPYKDYLGSRIELLNVNSGERKVVFETPDNLEAPNWHPDGYLILNGRGLLYKLPLDGAGIKQIPSGFATANNNDHGLSPNGNLLAISHHVAERKQGENSVIFILPAQGGTPRQVTPLSPSYWHGWSPNGESIIYTAMRNGQYDIYRIGTEGGKETQLTNTPGLDDGSDYSACGNYIWFNSNRSGSMEIWRMRADGSDQTQITNDEYQNWFPHESPDGKWVVFLSYPADVDKQDHPYYKHVTLRLMDTKELKPRVTAHLYGGQGTINVPSWSPCSSWVAFVSNSLL